MLLEYEKKLKKRQRVYLSICVVSVIAFFLGWQLLTDVLHVFPSQTLPSPLKVFQSFIEKLTVKAPDNGTIWQHTWTSLTLALAGFSLGAVIGVPLGIAMAWFKKVELLVSPLFDLIRPIPPIAWIPLMIAWLGIGVASKSTIIFLGAFVPCVINTYAGIKQTKPVHLWVAQTFGASRNRMLLTVAIPTALPSIFTGLRISLGAAWTSLCAAEMLAASRGLGYMIQINRSLGRPDLIIVGMLTIGSVGALLAFLLSLLEKKMVKGK